MNNKGVYTLIIHIVKNIDVRVGSIGFIEFSRGFYTYTGSALGSGSTGLMGRIQRHLKKEKKCFWHIDYLLKSKYASVRAVIYASTERRFECEIVREMVNSLNVEPLRMFGSGDCRKRCKSHLHYFIDNNLIIEDIIGVYHNLSLMPKLFTLALNNHFD
ncbi:MAG: GIY-YIG nuclease family protein [Candidatus Methylarchaceae archaeon HK02M2]|nr:GIY-YIG nuclease family protein [Candidatus Methylarchaceae archaeon HK02M2]